MHVTRMGRAGKGQEGLGRARQGWAGPGKGPFRDGKGWGGPGSHLGGVCGSVGTEEALEGNASVVSAANCRWRGGVSGRGTGGPRGPHADSPGGLSGGLLGTRFSAGFRGLRSAGRAGVPEEVSVLICGGMGW